MTILDYYAKEKEIFLKNCIKCGICAEECPVLLYTDIRDVSAQDIQEEVFDFINTGEPNHLAYTKAFACMECFRCTADMCPEGLDPMLANELIKGEYLSRGMASSAFMDNRQPDSPQRVLASIQVSMAEYKRITTSSGKQGVRYVFFPGCNVYVQPEKILNALDILDAIGEPYAFIPGLDYCCGDNHLFFGDIEAGQRRAEKLIATMAGYQPQAVVLWCPTCQCRFAKYLSASFDLPFSILSFAQYLANNVDKLPLHEVDAGVVTLHEACKSAYTGVDPDGPREVLRRIPGVRLREMEHHGRETACCGSGAVCWFPESFEQMRKARLREAARTGADQLVTVCHYCAQTFAAEEACYKFGVTNYVNLVAKAMGIQREDKFKKYTLLGNVERILSDAAPYVSESPFEIGRIQDVLRQFFAG